MKCDELKAFAARKIDDGACDPVPCVEVYLKSEADKVIDFWKNESHNHYERWFNLNKQYEGWFGKVCRCERAERELRRQKYKRCSAMAKWCFTKSNYHFVLARHGEDGKENNRKSILYSKWRQRWLELAEKFKEAK